jgi:phage host-nuclease inhibitor protein Gam
MTPEETQRYRDIGRYVRALFALSTEIAEEAHSVEQVNARKWADLRQLRRSVNERIKELKSERDELRGTAGPGPG